MANLKNISLRLPPFTHFPLATELEHFFCGSYQVIYLQVEDGLSYFSLVEYFRRLFPNSTTQLGLTIHTRDTNFHRMKSDLFTAQNYGINHFLIIEPDWKITGKPAQLSTFELLQLLNDMNQNSCTIIVENQLQHSADFKLITEQFSRGANHLLLPSHYDTLPNLSMVFLSRISIANIKLPAKTVIPDLIFQPHQESNEQK
jgi:hypothetical protein